jgi:hypothetical protein
VAASEGDAIFHLVWTYNIKAVDGRKKARCVCDGSTHSANTQTAWIKHAHNYSMLSPLLRIC